ncbi:YtpR family tRNA-binding protein [Halobacillus seohaensis]|uniref:YtpR family tRNA-binding protein n=1 Tax=Halobacillus seohaensis TaxID=447421 RepID=A0ABW2ELT4_9BACI
MDVFYNPNGVGDVLIIPIKEGDRLTTIHQTIGDVVKITNQQDGSLLGYNIFNASNHFSLTEHGKIQMTEDMLNKLKNLFLAKDLNDPLDFDLSPKFVIGYVKEKGSHENADKLSVCQVDVGDEILQIVCGAPNVDVHQHVVVAKVGATMPSGMKIKDAELRGVPSSGMICSPKELGLPNAPEEKGILVLDESPAPGKPFQF